MRRLSLLLAFAMLAACAGVRRSVTARHPSPARLDRDEVAIISLVTDSVLDTAGDPFVVMAESTFVADFLTRDLGNWATRLDSTFPVAALRDFEARNRPPVAVPRATLSGKRIRHLRLGSFDPERDRDSAYVLRGYEPVRSLHLLSRPGFDPERRRAVMTTATGCGGFCADTRIVLLARDARGWHVTRWEVMDQG